MEKMLHLQTPVEKITGIGSKTVPKLRKLGIEKIIDLLFHFPARYEDFSKIVPISHLKSDGIFCVRGRILQIKNQRSPKKRMFLTHALIADDSGTTKAVWFNQPFLTRILKKGDEIILGGKFEYGYEGFAFQNPDYEKIIGNELLHMGRIVPVYPETEGLNSKLLRKIIKSLLFLTSQVIDFLPAEVKNSLGLMDLSEALRQIHFPDSFESMKEAKKRLAFDELFLIQLKMLKMKKDWQENEAPKMKFDVFLVKSLLSKLPFKLTNAQRRAAWEILVDLQKSTPMNRLLEGDVGSGKTVVAAIAMLVVAKNGYQSVFMAPTEILAIQHYQNLVKLLGDFNISIGLLTSGKSELNGQKVKKSYLIEKIKEETDIVIGTHALIQEKIKFKNLGLAIIDEQHRFGVKQRALLRERARMTPHLLSMSATPIPRTLSLALYGDLDLSILDEMPPGRQKISTHLVPPNKREAAYNFIRKQVNKGRQVFVICPLIEETDKLGVRAATEEYQKLKKEVFPEFNIGLLHGKMKTKEKEKIMADFRAKKFDILVSTAVVEVGVDIPNASVMMIEGAERFGLAQLHQFRGRVGRAEHKSYCFLFTETLSDKAYKRLKALVNLDDGFQLAEKDLELRGPGEIYGVKQHGFWDLKMASLSDRAMLQKAREEAQKIIKRGLEKYPLLLQKLEDFVQTRRLE